MLLEYITRTRQIRLYKFSNGAFIIGRKLPFLQFTARWGETKQKHTNKQNNNQKNKQTHTQQKQFNNNNNLHRPT